MTQEIKRPETSGAVAPRYRDPFTEMRAEMDRVFENFLAPSRCRTYQGRWQ
jgi:hypothetical protein